MAQAKVLALYGTEKEHMLLMLSSNSMESNLLARKSELQYLLKKFRPSHQNLIIINQIQQLNLQKKRKKKKSKVAWQE
jgi:hypothetical protein